MSVAVQVFRVPVVGPSIRTANSHPDVESTWDAGSVIAQWRTTYSPPELPRYHPFVPEIPVIVYEMDGELTSRGLGFAAGASHISPRIVIDGATSRPPRRSHDLSFEITDPLHGRWTSRPGNYSLVSWDRPCLSMRRNDESRVTEQLVPGRRSIP